MSVPAATTRYSGISRFTVLPSAAIGSLNGSAKIASSGNASGRRRISSTSAPITSSAPTAAAAITPAPGSLLASSRPAVVDPPIALIRQPG